MVVDNLKLHGITTVVLNLCAALVSNGACVDILCGGTCEVSIENRVPHGTRIVRLPNRKTETLVYLKALRRCVSEGNYDCVHFHCNSATVFADLLSIIGLRCKIALHCHNVTCDHLPFHIMFRRLVTRLSDYRFACSSEAGKWMYGSELFTVVPNCFDTYKFKFNMEKRIITRAKLGIDNETIVYGHVGMFNEQKNQSFLLKIFEDLARMDRNTCLLLIGDGPLKKDILEQIPDSLFDKVIAVDPTNQIDEMYCAMDCFLFPSLFESLGLAAVEAQLNGLSCFVSNEVPDEACISDVFYKLPHDATPQDWADEIETRYFAGHHCSKSMKRVRPDIDFEKYSFKELVKLSSTLYTM